MEMDKRIGGCKGHAFSERLVACDFSKGLACVKDVIGKRSFIDKDGKVMIPYQWILILSLSFIQFVTVCAQSIGDTNCNYEFIEKNDSTIELCVSINGYSGKFDYFKLKSETKNLSVIDIEKLKNESDVIDTQIKQADTQFKTYTILYNNHKTTYEIVKEAKTELTRTESAWRRLSEVADLATGGQNAEGGKLSFERYMMGYVFREVLEMANHHLDIMSGGRYELQHEMNARRQYQAAGQGRRCTAFQWRVCSSGRMRRCLP